MDEICLIWLDKRFFINIKWWGKMDNISLQGLIISIIDSVFGEYWHVFIAYMIFGLLDWITGSLETIKLKKVALESK